MAFGFVKKIGKGIVKGVGAVGKVGVKAVKIIPKPIRNLAYETIVPAPIRKVVSKAVKAVEKIPVVKTIVSKLVNKGVQMNSAEKVIRELVELTEAAKGGGAALLPALLETVMALSSAYQDLNDLTPAERVHMFSEALDNLIGEEDNALIGPGKKVNLTIPFVSTETLSDLIIEGASKALEAKWTTTTT